MLVDKEVAVEAEVKVNKFYHEGDVYYITAFNKDREVFFRLWLKIDEVLVKHLLRDYRYIQFPLKGYKLKKIDNINYTVETCDNCSVYLLKSYEYTLIDYVVYDGNHNDITRNVKFYEFSKGVNSKLYSLYVWEVPSKHSYIRMHLKSDSNMFFMNYSDEGVMFTDTAILSPNILNELHYL